MGEKPAADAKRRGDAPSPCFPAGLSDGNLYTCKPFGQAALKITSHPSDLQINEQCFRYHVLEGKLLVIFWKSVSRNQKEQCKDIGALFPAHL